MLPLVKEFYANMLRQDQCNIWVRNSLVPLDTHIINAYYNLPTNIEREYSKLIANLTDKIRQQILQTLTVEKRTWANEEGRVVNRVDLTPVAQVWVKFLKSHLMPITHTTTVSQERLVLLYVLVRGLSIDVGTIIEREIRECAMKQHKNAAFFFPSLITGICIVFGVRVTSQDELIRNAGALNARTIERITGETTAEPTDPVAIINTRRAMGIERKLQELNDSITQCVAAQQRENNRFWAYLMHLDNHLHQFVVYMKDHHKNFPESLLQQFNFGTPVTGSEEVTIDLDSATEPKEEDQPTQVAVKSPVPEAHSSTEQEEERDSRDDQIGPSQVPPTRGRFKHTIGDDDEEETKEEPPIPIPSSKGKEKVLHDEDSEKCSEDIDAELEATTDKVTHTPTARKNLLEIITEITTEVVATAKSTPTAPLQPPAKSPSATIKTTSKRKGATSRGTIEPAELEPKCTRSTQATPSTSPPPHQKKPKSTIPS